MTNFEKYKDAVLSMIDDKCELYGVVDGEPVPCEDVDCFKCQLHERTNVSCTSGFVKWLYQEYQEKPKLSARAYHFLKSLPNGARIRECNPHLQIQTDETQVIDDYRNSNYVPELPPLVNEVWYEVSEILKWEVEG